MKITQTWSYNHKTLIALIALLIVVVLQSGLWDVYKPAALQPEVMAYQREPQGLEQEIEARARELYAQNQDLDLERYRQEAMQEILEELQALTSESPFVDYQELKEKYGY